MTVQAVTMVGSRETPLNVCTHLSWLAFEFARNGLEVRSGHTEGADWAAEQGACQGCDADAKKPGIEQHKPVIYLPWAEFCAERAVLGRKVVVRPSFLADQLVRDHHPAADRLSAGAFALHRRNGHQVLGDELNDPSIAVVCWRALDAKTSGTDQAMRIARVYGVPVYNLALGCDCTKDADGVAVPGDGDLGVVSRVVLKAVLGRRLLPRPTPPATSETAPTPSKLTLF